MLIFIFSQSHRYTPYVRLEGIIALIVDFCSARTTTTLTCLHKHAYVDFATHHYYRAKRPLEPLEKESKRWFMNCNRKVSTKQLEKSEVVSHWTNCCCCCCCCCCCSRDWHDFMVWTAIFRPPNNPRGPHDVGVWCLVPAARRIFCLFPVVRVRAFLPKL